MKILYSFLIAFLIISCQKDSLNQPPVVNAGSDITVTLAKSTDSIKLVGSASDADGHVVSYLWSLVSGPGTPVILTPGSATTYVKDFVSGTYVVQLTATDDKGASGVKTVQLNVTVTTVVAENKPPVVNAGNDITATLAKATDSVKLTGSATDADGTVVGYLWSQVSGPNTAVITSPGSATTYIKGLVSGTYVFQLMATDDKGATGIKSVKAVVTVPSVATLTLAATGDAMLALYQYGGDLTNRTPPDLGAAAWTSNGGSAIVRSVLKFDYSSIPSNATIVSAKLSLYSDLAPINGDLVHANAGSNNTFLIQRALSSWSGSTVGWSNQPSGDAASQVVIPHTSQPFLDLVDVDVTNQVRTMFSGNNYGFLLRLQTEDPYNSRLFNSSRSAYPDKHPKLVIQYSVQ